MTIEFSSPALPAVSGVTVAKPTALVVRDLAWAAPVVSADSLIADVDRLFRRDRSIRGVIVRTGGSACLLSREQIEFELSGPFGYGRSLHSRSTVRDLVLPGDLALSESLSLAEAAEVILSRDPEFRYHDVLVVAGDGHFLVVSVSAIFEQLSLMFRHVALHDPLTGLPNRRLLDDVGLELARRGVDAAEMAMLYVDLDGFKYVNDTYGHRAGDEVLIGFGDRLRSCVRPTDVIARLGGDEFAALLTNVSEVQAMAIADRIVLTASAPFVYDDQALYLSASVGLAMAEDVGIETGLSAVDVLLRHADGAMLHAKRSGKHRVKRLAGGLAATTMARRGLIRRRLGLAIGAKGALALHYQLKLDLATNTMHTAEALLRWRDGELGDVAPMEFIPLAEETDQIHRLGQWVLDAACSQARQWLDAGTPRTISVNVSPVQLARARLADDVLNALAAYALPPHLLRVEVTEGAAIIDLPAAVAQLRRLRTAGIDVELDDFGVGYSSLAMLRDLPLSAVKIDKTFIDNLDTDAAGRLLVGGIIEAAHTLDLHVIAEGVERQTQLDVLRELGCDSAQGYLIAYPAPAADLRLS